MHVGFTVTSPPAHRGLYGCAPVAFASEENFPPGITTAQLVEADELSYPFHVFLRYDVERALFAGELDVATIPQQWNSYMKDRLDVDVPDDASGVESCVEINQ